MSLYIKKIESPISNTRPTKCTMPSLSAGTGFLLISSLSDSVEFVKNGKEIHIYKTVVDSSV
jgi:hypothetical protein